MFLKLFISLLMVIYFYKYMKLMIIKVSNIVACRTLFKRYFPLLKVAGVIELLFITFSHLIFAAILLKMTRTSSENLGILTIRPIYLIYGILLGIGVSGVSAFLCQQASFMLGKDALVLFPSKSKFSMRSGWMRHHHDAKELLPIYLWSVILFIQLSSEELVFRGAFLHLFLSHGVVIAVVFSTFLFVYMELFFMPSKHTALFPMIGALVMGLSHAYLFSQVPNIFPLIVSHFVFFIFTIL